jgi:hypothetical protein
MQSGPSIEYICHRTTRVTDLEIFHEFWRHLAAIYLQDPRQIFKCAGVGGGGVFLCLSFLHTVCVHDYRQALSQYIVS